MSQQITCIVTKSHVNTHERITHIGWTGKKVTVEQGIKDVRKDAKAYYVQVKGHTQYLEIARKNDTEYLRTDRDGDTLDNLLSLPECK